jgi:LPXTG-motif cell wall-anchored protein
VYGLASEGPYSLSLTLPNFGYPLGTIEDTNKVESHTVSIIGLVPNQIYNYRVVSRASPPTVSNEYSFILKEDGTVETNSPLALATQENAKNNELSLQPVIAVSANAPIRTGETVVVVPTPAAAEPAVPQAAAVALSPLAAILTLGTGSAAVASLVTVIALLVIGGGFWLWKRRRS